MRHWSFRPLANLTLDQRRGQFVRALRLGWREVPGLDAWLRVRPGARDDTLFWEFSPTNAPLPKHGGGQMHFCWWEGDPLDVVGLEAIQPLLPIDRYICLHLTNLDEPVENPSRKSGNGHPKSLRFSILSRDNFRCRYCGRTADQAELQIDHVVPRSKGGATEADNLITACWDCNIGKRDVLLSDEMFLALSQSV